MEKKKKLDLTKPIFYLICKRCNYEDCLRINHIDNKYCWLCEKEIWF